MPSLMWMPRGHDSRSILDNSSAWEGHGFLLDNDKVTSAPPVITTAAIAVDATYVAYWVGGRDYDKGTLLLVAKSGANYKLYNYPAFVLGAEIATGGKTFSAIESFSNIPVLPFDAQYTVIGTSTELGLIDTIASTYTSIAGTGLRHHLTKHLTRVIATDFAGTVYWCVPGTLTDWTTTASGAGSTNIGEIAYGLAVVQNKLVILTPNSVHYGYPTGTLTPVYRFERVISNTPVCDDMQSVAQYQDTLFYKNLAGVFKLVDGQQINIGEPVWDNILALSNSAKAFKGEILYSFDSVTNPHRPQHAQPWYVMFPLKTSNTSPILAYNIMQEKWAVLFTSENANLTIAYTGKTAFALDSVRMLRQDNNLISYHSQSTGTVSRTLMLKSPPLTVEDPTRDYTSDEAFIWYTDTGEVTLTFTLTGTQSATTQTITQNFSIGTAGASGKVMRERIPIRGIVGQPFQIAISYTGATRVPVVIHRVQVVTTDGGAFRGL